MQAHFPQKIVHAAKYNTFTVNCSRTSTKQQIHCILFTVRTTVHSWMTYRPLGAIHVVPYDEYQTVLAFWRMATVSCIPCWILSPSRSIYMDSIAGHTWLVPRERLIGQDALYYFEWWWHTSPMPHMDSRKTGMQLSNLFS